MLQFWQFSSRMHQKPPQSTHKIQNFLGGMPPDPLEVVGPRAHQVPWLPPASRYAPATIIYIATYCWLDIDVL